MRIIRKLKYPITILFVIGIIIGAIYLNKKLNDNKYEDIIIEDELLVKEEPIEEKKEIELCSVDIKGAVKAPGVYIIECTSNINDAIKKANGLTEQADTSVINLAKKITDEMVIIVYTKEEVKNSNIVDTVVKVVEQECKCPNIQNDGCINQEIKEEIGQPSLININTATKEELQTINGIGESKANNIIKYRETIGNFKNIEDIKNVEGIGETLYETIKIYITT